ncbi:MAG: hypothetical protein QOJ64_3352 [Acidobacteriota bacterium]|nr:hypothetical protein [Acidobacteriota bacterium]
MKRCPVCARMYSDDALNYCLDDGTTLLLTTPTGYDSADAPTANFSYGGGTAPTQVMHGSPTATNRSPVPTAPPPFLAAYPQRRNSLPWIVGGLALLIIAVVVFILAGRASNVTRDGGDAKPSPSIGSTPGSTPAPTPSHLAWQTLTGDGFSIYMPGSPSKSEQTEPSLAGPITIHLYTAAQGYEAFMAGDTTYPDAVFASGNTEQIMDGARDGAVSSVEGQISNERKITLGSYSGREVTGSSPSKNLSFTLRLYVAKPKMFIILYSQYGKDKPLSDDGRKFLDSFQITQ